MVATVMGACGGPYISALWVKLSFCPRVYATLPLSGAMYITSEYLGAANPVALGEVWK
jgi:hypothetical protein